MKGISFKYLPWTSYIRSCFKCTESFARTSSSFCFSIEFDSFFIIMFFFFFFSKLWILFWGGKKKFIKIFQVIRNPCSQMWIYMFISHESMYSFHIIFITLIELIDFQYNIPNRIQTIRINHPSHKHRPNNKSTLYIILRSHISIPNCNHRRC